MRSVINGKDLRTFIAKAKYWLKEKQECTTYDIYKVRLNVDCVIMCLMCL